MMKEVSICFFLCALIPVALSHWRSIQGKAADISAKGDELWITTGARHIFRWNEKTGSWQVQPGRATRVGASPDGWTWITTDDQSIYRLNPNTGGWQQMPGQLSQINAISKDSAIGVNRQNHIYLWENNNWKLLPGKAAWACIGEDDERWIVSPQQDVYRWNHDTRDWIHMPGKAVVIDCQSPDKVIITNAQQYMYVWKDRDWILMSGQGVRATVGNENAYTVSNGGDIWDRPLSEFGIKSGGGGGAGAGGNQANTNQAKQPTKPTKPADNGGAGAKKEDDRDKFDFDVPTVENVDKELDDDFNVVLDKDKN